MLKRILVPALVFIVLQVSGQQAVVNPRPLTLDEYKKALTFRIADLDKDTYVKFDNAYILDRYESRKPYFVTGGDSLKKRIDLYTLIAREGRQEIGLMIFYTTESGKQYQALQPDFTADAKVWAKYFQDIDDINKVEKNFVLKLSYILSKEMSFQQFKGLNGGKSMKDEAATYGTDICFPGEEEVAMTDGSKKPIREVQPGDEIVTVDPVTHRSAPVRVRSLTVHAAKNYAITELVLVNGIRTTSKKGIDILLYTRVVKATPNHPMLTTEGNREIGDIKVGEQVLCTGRNEGGYQTYTVVRKTEHGEGVQPVYNIEADGGNTLLLNGVMVKQK